MAVHSNSKIDTWLNDFNSEFYVSLTDKEEWVFDNHTGDELSAWEDYFELLMVKINEWATTETLERGITSTKGLVSMVAMYIKLYTQFNSEELDLGENNQANLSADKIYDMNGFIELTISRPVDYYDDIVEVPPEPPELEPTQESVKMINDLDLLDSEAWQDNEKTKIQTALSLAGAAGATINYVAMFNTFPPVVTVVSKESLATLVFVDLKYAHYGEYITGIKGIEVPVYPEPEEE